MRRALHRALLAASILLATSAASAQKPAASPADLAKAKMLYDVGAQAFEGANYPAAIKAFTEAYRIAERPGLVFSIAQAHRKQYLLTKNVENLREAIRYYRDYAAKVPQGGRRADVAEALAELEPVAARLDVAIASQSPPASVPVPEARPQAQLMISTQTKGAMVSLDGGSPTPMPLVQDVKPGNHTIKVTAEGHFDYEREIKVGEEGVLPLDIPLRERPALLMLQCDSGAEVSVDGRPVATTPLVKPIELSPGRHFIAVTKGGHKPITQDIEVKRAEKKTIPFRLEMTGQRIASYTMLVTGTVSLVGGVLLALGAAGAQDEAEDILAVKARENLTEEQRANYQDALKVREELRNGAVVGLGAGAVLGAAGLVLYIFEQPPPIVPPFRLDDGPAKPSSAPGELKMEVGAAPMFGPGFAGASVIGRF